MRRSFLTAAVIAGLPLGLGAAQFAAAQSLPSTSAAPATATAPAAAPATAPGPGSQAGRHAGMMKAMQARFVAANTSHDGHLTLAQAQAAGLKIVVASFSDIDTKNRGYVTFNDIMAWRLDKMAQRLQGRAAALRAQD